MSEVANWEYPCKAMQTVSGHFGFISSLQISEILTNAARSGAVEVIGVAHGDTVPRPIPLAELGKCDAITEADFILWKREAAPVAHSVAFTGVRIDGNALTQYLRRYHPQVSLPSTINLETECGRWLRSLPETPIPTKTNIKCKAKENWPELTGRGFTRAWDNNAHQSWRRAGRR